MSLLYHKIVGIARFCGELGWEVATNHAEGVYGIRNLLRYGIATKERMESSRSDVWHQSAGERDLIRASRDAIRDFVAIPYNARAR